MDKMAIREIENAIRRAKARMKTLPLVCDCMNEMEEYPRYIVCRYCGKIHWKKPRYNDGNFNNWKPKDWYR